MNIVLLTFIFKTMLEIIKPELPENLKTTIIDYFRGNIEGTKQNLLKNKFANVPNFMIKDLFNSYLTKETDLRYMSGESMHWWYSMIKQMNNYLLKIVTQDKPGYSFIALKHVMELLAEIMDEENKEDSRGEGDKPKKDHSDKIQKAMKQITKNIAADIEKQKDASDMTGTSNPGKEPSDIIRSESRMKLMNDVILSKKTVSKFIDKSIKSFKTGFSTKTTNIEEDLIDSEVQDDILDEYLLSNNMMIPDITVRDKKPRAMLFDLYIDVSGSMKSRIYINNKSVTRINLAQTLGIKMKKMNCLNNLYAFSSHIMSFEKDHDAIWNLKAQGGTNIDRVIQNVRNTKRPSIILTDGDDRIGVYDKNVFLMSIVEESSHRHTTEIARKMIKQKKYLTYQDGKLIVPKLQ